MRASAAAPPAVSPRCHLATRATSCRRRRNWTVISTTRASTCTGSPRASSIEKHRVSSLVAQRQMQDKIVAVDKAELAELFLQCGCGRNFVDMHRRGLACGRRRSGVERHHRVGLDQRTARQRSNAYGGPRRYGCWKYRAMTSLTLAKLPRSVRKTLSLATSASDPPPLPPPLSGYRTRGRSVRRCLRPVGRWLDRVRSGRTDRRYRRRAPPANRYQWRPVRRRSK